jgi:diguanylate cyclase (GGDEF)-like protein
VTVENSRAPVGLDACAAEPIRIPGSIQPHGVLLALNPETLAIEQLSANSAELLGASPQDLIGRSPGTFLGERTFAEIAVALRAEPFEPGVYATTAGPHAQALECVSSRHADTLVLEFQPYTGAHSLDMLDVSMSLQAPLARMERTKNIVELARLVAQDVRHISGFDRVMVYRFDNDWHGEVIAEDVNERYAQRFLGLHFPASDIPAQARDLYLLNKLRLIPDVDYVPVPIVPLENPRQRAPLDLSRSDLRSVSPVHLEYLRNMDVRATMTISIIVHGKLWGLVACHNSEPRRITYAVRSTCNFFTQMLAMTITARVDQADLSVRLNASQRVASFVAGLEATQSIWESLRRSRAALLRMFAADALLMRGPEGTEVYGATTSALQLEPALRALQERARNGLASTASLCRLDPLAADFAEEACGALYLGLSGSDNRCLVFLRREQQARVSWSGDPRKSLNGDAAMTQLTPRASFAAWEEIKRFESSGWTTSDLEKAGLLRDQLIAWQQAREEVRLLAHYDTLTQLPNRRLLDELLRHALNEAAAQNRLVGLLFIDVDRFKRFNDRLGHAGGDRVLREVATRAARVLREGDLVGRLGGDEFVVIMPGLPNPQVADQVAQRLIAEIGKPLEGIEGPDLSVTVSIGMSFYPTDGITSEALLGKADSAMYRAKQTNRDAAEEIPQAPSIEHGYPTEVARTISKGITAGEFVAHFQPIVDLTSGRVVAVEALARWNHPERGQLLPGEFIGVAENSDLIVRLGSFMLDSACAELSRWRRSTEPGLRVAVNVSPRQLRDGGLVTTVRETLRRYELPPDALELEVTEGVMGGDSSQSVDTLRDLADIGVRIAIDDFGTGFSSLNYLRRLPVNALKVDRSFVAELEAAETRETGTAIVNAIVSLAKSLDLEVVAEGVETKTELALVRALGCNFAQGYYLGRPMVAEAYPSFLVEPAASAS